MITTIFRQPVKRAWPAALLLFLAGVSQAATVTLDGSRATGISDLDLGSGTLYDVIFERVTATVSSPLTLSPCDDPSAVAGVPCDLFVLFATPNAGDITGAESAVDAINVALNSAGATAVGPASSAFSRTLFTAPFEYCDITGGGPPEPGVCGIRGFNTTGTWSRIPGSTAEIFQESADLVMARFTPSVSAVPLPASVYLFATGLGLLVARIRKGGKLSS